MKPNPFSIKLNRIKKVQARMRGILPTPQLSPDLTFGGPLLGQGRPVVRHLGQDMYAPRKRLGCLPGQGKYRNLPSAISPCPYGATAATSFIISGEVCFLILQSQNPKCLFLVVIRLGES